MAWVEVPLTEIEAPVYFNWGGDRAIAVFGSNSTAVEYYNIPTPAATSTSFGNLTTNRRFPATGSNGTYGVIVAGYNQILNTIDYITIATPGNASDFGDATKAIGYTYGSSDGTTMFYGTPTSNTPASTLEYITIATSGSGTTFIDLLTSSYYGNGLSNLSRTLFTGLDGDNSGVEYFNNLTATSVAEWGNLVVTTHSRRPGASNETYGIFAGGSAGGFAHQQTSAIDYVTIDTLGTAGSFGTLTESKASMTSSSNGTIASFAGGSTSSASDTRTIEYVNIGTSGNASDWGDLIGIFTEGRPGNGQIAGNPA